MSSNTVVLVTGTSSGFGLLIVKTLSAAGGFTVIASARGIDGKNADKVAPLRELPNVHVVEIDVTSTESVNAGVAAGVAAAGAPIDVVINNAGSATSMGWTETISPEQFQRQFDVNVTGVHRVNRAVLPSMRERGTGLIIHITSVVAKSVFPWMASYIASKFALDAYSEILRVEMAQFGIDVIDVLPGGYGTGFLAAIPTDADADRLAAYGEHAEAPSKFFGGFKSQLESENGPDPQEIADHVLNLINTPAGSRPHRTVSNPAGGEAIQALSDLSDATTEAGFNGMGLSHMLKLKTDA